MSEYTPKGITPLPLTPDSWCGHRQTTVLDGNGKQLFTVTWCDDWQQKQDYLMHAANEYPKAIEALRALMEWFHGEGRGDEAFAKADAVLAAAREVGEKND